MKFFSQGDLRVALLFSIVLHSWAFHWLSWTWFIYLLLFLLDSVMLPAPSQGEGKSSREQKDPEYGKGRKSHQSNYTPSGEVPIET